MATAPAAAVGTPAWGCDAGAVATIEQRVDVGGTTLMVTEAGPPDGPPVLLLHGFPDSRRLWDAQVEALAAAGHRVLAPDLRGYGDSDRPTATADYALEHLIADVAGLLRAGGITRAALVGHDWGAVVAWAVAAAHPELVERLVVVSVGHPAARARAGLRQQVAGAYVPVFLVPGLAERLLPLGRFRWLRRAWAPDARGGPHLARQVADMSRPGALTAGLAWYRANIPVPRPGRALRILGRTSTGRSTQASTGTSTGRPRRRVACPVMGVWSTGDPFLTERQMTGSADHVAGPWRYERIEGAGHWVPVEAADRLSTLLVDFLAGDPG